MATKKTKPAVKAKKPTPAVRPIEAILDSMREGNSLRKACKANIVPISTFLMWVDADKDLAEQYTQARARMLDAQAEQLEELGELAAAAETAVEVAGLRLQCDNRKWLLSKLAPKKYGEKMAIGGADDLPPVQQIHGMSTEALLAIASRASVTKNP
jgi:hypothetical protein